MNNFNFLSHICIHRYFNTKQCFHLIYEEPFSLVNNIDRYCKINGSKSQAVSIKWICYRYLPPREGVDKDWVKWRESTTLLRVSHYSSCRQCVPVEERVKCARSFHFLKARNVDFYAKSYFQMRLIKWKSK